MEKLLLLPKRDDVMRNRLIILFTLVFSAVCAFAQPVTITPPSATIEPGGSVTLTASGALYYQWSPATGLSTTDGPVTVASPMVTTTYTCSGYAPGDESVVNGDFEQGNVGFTSAYEYNSNLWGEGTYYVDYDASLHHESFVGLGHNGGNFMMVNGATVPSTNVWTEQITVNPNTYYAFSTWVCTLAGQANEVALLQFSINGNQIGNVFSAPPYTNEWRQFYELWYSGNSTSATITILNQNTVGSGNDFGLDDISFCELVLVGAPQCTVYVGSMSASATADDTELCEGESTTLHALPVNGSGNYTYNWTPASTLDNPTSQHPVATPTLGATTYTCHVSDVSWGNTQDVSVTIVVHPNAEMHIDEAICSNEVFNFFGENLNASGEYEHMLQTQYGCDSIIRLSLTVYPPNDTTIVDPSICVGETYNFHGTLYHQDGQIAYFDTVDYHGCLKVEKLILSVGEYQMPPVEDVHECYGHNETPYFRWDKNNVEYYSDTYDEAVVPDPNGGCDFKYRLNLKFHQDFYMEEDPVMACDEYTWWATGETVSGEGVYNLYKNFKGGGGPLFDCDSVYVLTVTINEQSQLDDVYIQDSCDFVSVHWYNSQDTVFYENTVYKFTGLTDEGCYLEQTYHIENMQYTPSPDKIRPLDPSTVVFGGPDADADTVAVITNTEFFSFQYVFYVDDMLGHIDDWASYEWYISQPSWMIEPFVVEDEPDKRFCRVYVAEHHDDYVELRCTVYNQCKQEGVSRAIYFKSSFFDIDEQNAVQPDFCVLPNPNNGQMTLLFNHFEGKVDVKVYDVTGNLVDSFVTCNDMDSNTLEYNMKVHSGIYFIVAHGREGTLAKKVIVNDMR